MQFDSEAFPVSQDKSAALRTSQMRGPQVSMCCSAPRDRMRVEDAQGGAWCVALPVCVP